MSTKSKKRKKRRAFLKQAREIAAIVDAEILDRLIKESEGRPYYIVEEPKYVGQFPVRGG